MTTAFTPSPLTPLSANSNKLPAPSVVKHLFDLQQEDIAPGPPHHHKSPAKPAHADSPFMSFSPIAAGAASPKKKPSAFGDSLKTPADDENWDLDDSICSTFSDVPFAIREDGVKSFAAPVPNKNSSVKVRIRYTPTMILADIQ